MTLRIGTLSLYLSEPFETVSLLSPSSPNLNPSSSSSKGTRTRIRCSEAHLLPSCHKRHYLAEGEVAPYEKYWIPKFAPKDKAQLDENGQPLPIGFKVTNRPRSVDSAPKTWWCGVYCRKFHDITQIPFGKCPKEKTILTTSSSNELDPNEINLILLV